MDRQKSLIVDDDIDLRDSLKVVFENAGYATMTAGNRSEGMEKIRAERPDLIILDVMMETWQDGFEMSRELKEDPQFKSVPILMLTSISTRTGVEIKSSAGDPVWLPVAGFLDKPTPSEVLLAEVMELLQTNAPRGSETCEGVADLGGVCRLAHGLARTH